VWQSISQARKHYPENWGLFMGGGMLAFRPGDMDTAKFLVEKTGTHTVPVLSAADPSSGNESEMRPSWAQQKRERIPLAKMFGMPPGTALVWLPGDEAPRVSRMKGYFAIKKLNARASENPYFKGSGKRRPRKLLKGVIAASILAFVLARPDLARQVAAHASSNMSAILHYIERSVTR
jgi:type IV secretory pathway TraG/TraD family ATPase VirD4